MVLKWRSEKIIHWLKICLMLILVQRGLLSMQVKKLAKILFLNEWLHNSRLTTAFSKSTDEEWQEFVAY